MAQDQSRNIIRGLGDLDSLETYKRTNKFKLPDGIKNFLTASLHEDLAVKLEEPYILPFAVNASSTEACKIFLEKGINVNGCYKGDYGKETALHCAVGLDSFSKCHLLMQYNPDLTIKWRGMTPLQMGIANGCSASILQLLGINEDMGYIEQYLRKLGAVGETPLTTAVRLGVKPWVEHFLTIYNPLERDGTGLNALQLARKKPELYQLVSQQVRNPDQYQEDIRNMLDWYTYEKQCSTKISAVQRKTSAQEFHDTVCKTRRFLTGECDERHTIGESIFSLASKVSTKMQSHFAFETICAGSTAEGTKTFMPNEFDIVCEFTQSHIAKADRVGIEGGDPVIRSQRGPWSDYLQENASKRPIPAPYSLGTPEDYYVGDDVNSEPVWGFDSNASPMPELTITDVEGGIKRDDTFKLDPIRVASGFYATFEKAIEQIITDVENGQYDFGNLHLFRKSLVLKDKISCLRLLWRGERYKDMVIYVDLVPAFKLEDPTLVVEKQRHLPSEVQLVPQYHLIAKFSRRTNYYLRRFQVSHSGVELARICSLPRNVKDGLLAAKMFRMRGICCPADIEAFQLEDCASTEDFITSYILKTCLMYVLEDCKGDLHEGTMYDWADHIYAKLEQYLENCHIPLYHEGTIDNKYFYSQLLRCSDHRVTENKFGCCLKRNLMLVLCREIREWLKNNQDELTRL